MAEPYVIKMPQLTDTMTEGVVVSWEKPIGARVERGDVVATIETDKAIMDVEVFRSGYLAGPLAAVDSVMPVGATMAYLTETPDEAVSPVQDAPVQSAPALASEPTTPTESEAPSGYAIKMPQLSDTMTEGVLVSWEKSLGDKIQRGDVVATIETDKAIMDVEVFREGYLSGPRVAVDAVVPVGEAIAWLVETADQVREAGTVSGSRPEVPAAALDKTPGASTISAQAPVAQPLSARVPGAQPAPRPQQGAASPFARQLAGQQGVDLNHLQGSGPAGVIVAADVMAATGSAAPATTGARVSEPAVPGEGRAMSAIEKAISQAMVASLSIPVFHVTVKAKPEALMRAAKAHKVSLTVAIAKAASQALAKHPLVNAAYQPTDKIVERAQHDIGIAATTEDGGLVVPVLRAVEGKDLAQLQSEWTPLVEKARKRRLSPPEYTHPTFTISNMGMYGISQFDAIVTPGTAAIIAIAGNSPDGMPITITADHRVVNGAEAALFLKDLKKAIEHPEGWLGAAASPIPEGDYDVQVLVIGAGPGGEDCARELVENGVKVAMVNNAPYPGGECLWRGCIPSKAWRAAADRIRDREHDAAMGLQMGTPKLDWAQLENHRRGILQTRGEMALKTDQGMKIQVLEGTARFTGEHSVEISGKDARSLSFGACVIATGAPAFVPPIPGVQEALKSGAAVTSDTVWDLAQPPRRLCVIGAGAIGMEMAQMFHDFGAEVLVLEALPRPVAEMEKEVSEQLMKALAHNSPRLQVLTEVKVQEVSGKPGALDIRYQRGEEVSSHACDLLLVATGKRPDTSALNLAAAGVTLAERGAIAASSTGQTSVAHIYAVGDVVGGYMLAHTAGQQGRVAAANLLGHAAHYDAAKDSGVTFTRPQCAFVGLSMEQAKAAGMDVAEVKVPMSIDAKAMMTGETDGLIKMVADKVSHRIVGVHFLADHADLLVGEAVMMVSAGLTLEQVAEAIHPHPTQTELFGEMARRLLSRLRRTARAAG